MKIIKLTPFILIIVGTIGLLFIELLGGSGNSFSRYAVLILAILNLLGLTILALSRKNQ